jgi:lipopolysaccharide transport system permease protein
MNTVSTFSWRQVQTLTSASIRSRYRNTFAGLLWVILNPVLMFSAQSFAFKYILKINVENYPLFLLTGLLPWIFFSSSISMGTTIIVSNARLYKSFPIHPLVSLTSTLIDNLINFVIAFVVILVPVFFLTPNADRALLLLLPFPLISLFIATIACSLILATLQVFLHDVKFIVDFVMSVAFYVTPIFYPTRFVDPQFRWIIDFNPFAVLLAPFQALSGTSLPDDFFARLGLSTVLSLCLLAFALYFWNRKKNMVYFYL